MIIITVSRGADIENDSAGIASVEITNEGYVTVFFGDLRPCSLIERHPFPIDSQFWRRVAGIVTAIADAQDGARGQTD